MKKVIGIILAALGLVGIAVTSVPQLKTYLSYLPASIQLKYVIVASLVLLIVGAFFLVGKTTKQQKEVPIYEGDKVVGYRRHSK